MIIFDLCWLFFHIFIILGVVFVAMLLKSNAQKTSKLLFKRERTVWIQHFLMQIEHRPIAMSSGLFEYDWYLVYMVRKSNYRS